MFFLLLLSLIISTGERIMKRFGKIIASLVIGCMLLIPFSSVVYAQDLFSKDNLSAIFEIIGVDLSDPDSIQATIDKIKEGGFSGILGLLGVDIGGIVDELQDFLFAFETDPTTTTEEDTTEEETESVAETTTEEPTYNYPSYEYTPPTYTPQTTLPEETTTLEIVTPPQIYTEAYTTAAAFNPIIEDDASVDSSPSNPVKTAVGIFLLIACGVGVIVVVITLKRNKI